MRKLKNNLIFLIPLLLTTTLSTYVTLPVVAQLVNGSNATDKTSEQSEEISDRTYEYCNRHAGRFFGWC